MNNLDEKLRMKDIVRCDLKRFKNKSGNSRLLVSGMKATRFQYLYVRSDILLISRWSVDCSIPI